jgi:hypothetical protein
MSNIHTPSEEKENSHPSDSQTTLKQLLHTSLSHFCDEGSDTLLPQYYNQFLRMNARENLFQDIRIHMKSLAENDKAFMHLIWTVWDITNEEIHFQILKKSVSLKNIRERAMKKIWNFFPNLEKNHWNEIEKSISTLTAQELLEKISTKKFIKIFLSDIIPAINIKQLEILDPKLKDIFPQQNLSDSLYQELLNAIELFDKTTIVPSASLLERIFSVYTPEQIQRISEYFWLTLSLRNLRQYGIIKKEEIETLVQSLFDDTTWNGMDDEQKKGLIESIQMDDHIELNPKDIPGLFSNKKIVTLLWNELHGTLKQLYEEEWKKMPYKSLVDFMNRAYRSWNESNWEISKILEKAFKPGNILVLPMVGKNPTFLKIQTIDKKIDSLTYGGEFSIMNNADSWNGIGNPKWSLSFSYEGLEKLFQKNPDFRILTEDELVHTISNYKTESGEQFYDARKEENEVTKDFLKKEIDAIDPKGKDIPIEKGMVFTATEFDEQTGNRWKKRTFTIEDIWDNSISVSNGRSRPQDVDFQTFVQAAKDAWLTRLALLKDDESFLKSLEPFGIESGTKLKDNSFVTEVEEDDGHGHKEKKEWKYEFFENSEGAHIRVTGIEGDRVMVWIYTGQKEEGKKKKSQYDIDTLTRGEFLALLKEWNLKATKKNLLDPHAGNDYHPHDPHMHSSFFWSVFKWLSINDMMKGFHNIIHGWEHYFEKNSKLNASRFALRMGRKFKFPMDIMAQLQADEVSSVKEVIEKIREKLWNLNGPVGRNKALHIAQLTSSSPEEVWASMLFMVKWYGHLYAEDIAHAQGSESFINGFLYSLGWKSTAEITAMKKTAREKFMADLWSGSDGWKPTEEELVWGLLKIFDGRASLQPGDDKYDPRYANAGAVTKAMGGPSGWERAWRSEGIKDAYEKGIRQGWAVVNAKWRVNKWVSAFCTHELNTVMGFMEKASGKAPDPVIQVLPVIWCLGWYSKYSSTEMLQKVKWFGDSMWHTFHAYAFTRNEEDNDTYTNLFLQALKAQSASKGDKAEDYVKTIRKWPVNEKENKKWADDYKNAILWLQKIWESECDKWLHEKLQWQSTWLVQEVQAWNKNAIKYANRFADIHKMNSHWKVWENDNDWFNQGGYNMSNMFWVGGWDEPPKAFQERNGMKVLSFDRMFRKLRTSGFDLDDDRKWHFWTPIVLRMEALKNEPEGEYKKAQYAQFRYEVIKFFRDKMASANSWWDEGAAKQVRRKSYYPDIISMWIDASEFFSNKSIDEWFEQGYKKWLSYNTSWTASQRQITQIEQELQKVLW